MSISVYSIGISRLLHQCVFVHGVVILQNNEGTCDVKVLEQGRSGKVLPKRIGFYMRPEKDYRLITLYLQKKGLSR